MSEMDRWEKALLAEAAKRDLTRSAPENAEASAALKATLRRQITGRSPSPVWQALKALGMAVCILSLCATTAFALSPEVRRAALLLTLETDEEAVRLTVADRGITVTAPDDWRCAWYPAWVPEGYHLQKWHSSASGGGDILFENGDRWVYLICLADGALMLDRESADISETTVANLPALTWYANQVWTTVWQDGSHYLALSVYGEDADTARRVAEGMVTLRVEDGV